MDINVRAFRLVREATEESSPKDKRKRAASKKGGIAGGRARANSLSESRKREIALAGSSARWSQGKPVGQAQEKER